MYEYEWEKEASDGAGDGELEKRQNAFNVFASFSVLAVRVQVFV